MLEGGDREVEKVLLKGRTVNTCNYFISFGNKRENERRYTNV